MSARAQSITEKLCAALAGGKANAEKNEIIRDTTTAGFAIVVGKTRCSFIVEGRAGRGGRNVRSTLGTVGKLELDEARSMAKIAIGKLSKGIDLVEEHRQEVATQTRDTLTLGMGFDAAINGGDLREVTKKDYQRQRVLINWDDRLVRTITAEEIRLKYIELGANTTAANAMKVLRRAWYCCGDIDETLPKFPSKGLKKQKRGWNTNKRKSRTISDVSLPAWMQAVLAIPKREHRGQARDHKNAANVRDAILFMFYTGIRPAELTRLTVKDIDLQGATFAVVGGKTSDENETITLPLTRQTKAIMARVVAAPAFADGHLFDGILRHRPHLVDTLQIAKWSAGDFRRMFISAAHLAGVDDQICRRLTCHTVPATDAHAGYFITDANILRPHAQTVCDFQDKRAAIKRTKLQLVA